jgi:hypothetical protein
MHRQVAERLHSWKEVFWGKAMKIGGSVWLLVGVWDLIKSEFLPEKYQSWTVVTLTPRLSWRTWVIVSLVLLLLILAEGAHAAIKKRDVTTARLESEYALLKELQAKPNLQINWQGIIWGSLYLSDDGVWSASTAPTWSDTARFGFLALRIKVTNPHIKGKKIGPAIGVSGQVEFSYDTGLSGWSGAPAAWVHDPSAKVTLDVDHEKELIVTVGTDTVGTTRQWSVITNVRREDGCPTDRTAMQFRDAPWHSGKIRVSVIHDGEAQTMEYDWLDAHTGMPKVWPVTPLS